MRPRPEPDAPAEPDGTAPAASPRLHAGSVAVVAVLVLQVAVPLVALLLPPPQRFGFQMYSGYGTVSAVQVDDEGRETRVQDLESYVGNLRVDVDWVAVLPEELCDRLPDAASVTVRQSDRERSVPCD